MPVPARIAHPARNKRLDDLSKNSPPSVSRREYVSEDGARPLYDLT